jgi:hypothetical protein
VYICISDFSISVNTDVRNIAVKIYLAKSRNHLPNKVNIKQQMIIKYHRRAAKVRISCELAKKIPNFLPPEAQKSLSEGGEAV